ncbi:MAG: hypothetical protein FWB97_01810 [Oscillospiraceae bacterium]|nr:hypothetical protein [Oscillospiraceae bacterium]
MIEQVKKPDRDKALINILERMAGQIGKQDHLLEEIVKQQGEYAKEVSKAQSHRRGLQTETEQAIDKLHEAIGRYRGDMLSIVSEQDTITKNMIELNKLVNQAMYQMELSNKRLADLDKSVQAHEKTLGEKSDHIIKQTEIIPQEIAEASNRDAKMHSDTEKRIGELRNEAMRQLEKMHADAEKRFGELRSETQRQLDKMHADAEKRFVDLRNETQRQSEKTQRDTSRRLLILGDIDSALQTLLIRTEPPEKKPFIFIRIFKRVFKVLKNKLAVISWPFSKKEDEHIEEGQPMVLKSVGEQIKGDAPEALESPADEQSSDEGSDENAEALEDLDENAKTENEEL